MSAFSVTTRSAELPQEKRTCFTVMTKSAELSLEKKAHFCQDSCPILQTRKEIITEMCMCASWNSVHTLNLPFEVCPFVLPALLVKITHSSLRKHFYILWLGVPQLAHTHMTKY